MNTMTIGQVAELAGVGVETVRFYERKGLVPEPPRTPAGYRQYSPDTVRRLGFIQRAKELGFSLREIQELLDLRPNGSGCAAEVRAQAVAKIQDLDARIHDLRRMRAALAELTAACSDNRERGACAILEALENGGST